MSTMDQEILQECFQKIALTEEETLQAKVFSYSQRALIINEIQTLAATIVNHTYDHRDKEGWTNRLIELQGQIGILQYLLANSDNAQEELRQRAIQGDTPIPTNEF